MISPVDAPVVAAAAITAITVAVFLMHVPVAESIFLQIDTVGFCGSCAKRFVVRLSVQASRSVLEIVFLVIISFCPAERLL